LTVVFLHPIALDGECWQFLTSEQLEKPVRYDLLWHGGRPGPAVPLTLETFARDVVDNVEGELDIIGLSLGGAVALEIALRWPHRVRSLMLACSSAGGGRAGEVLRERAAEVERAGMAGVLEVTLRRWFTQEALDSAELPGIGYARERLLCTSPDSFAASWRALADNNAINELHTLRAPTTVLHGAQDVTGPIETRKDMVARIPGSRLAVIPGPHMVQLERPADFQEAVLDHLDWVGR
jgi:pimeloyl-ACP methyl ester carboxylesterase